MKKQLLPLFTGLLTLLVLQASAQKAITGKVAEKDGTPLVGVTVSEVGTANGTFTDLEGRFTIKVKDENAVLSFSYTGRETITRPVAGVQEINVLLEEDAKILDEVVVTALGFEEKEDELGYASSTVSSKAVTGAAESTMINALSGKASGIRISRNSGDPGSGAYIQIRGISTIDRDAQPLIVVDGIPISNDSRGAQETFAAQSRLNDINPNDIETVTVLKGASAAALWGTKALGGVIVITTKSGK